MDTRRQSGLWDQNPQTGEYERRGPSGPYQYYKPTVSSDKRRSFSERTANPLASDEAYRTATQNGLERSTSVKKADLYHSRDDDELEGQDLKHSLAQDSDYNGPQITHAKHINELEDNRPITDDGEEEEDIPDNLRRTAWSPEPESPTLPDKAPPVRHPSNASEHLRRGSVPERSPLQHLEAKLGDLGKEEKRARMEEAERRASRNSLDNDEGTLGRGTSLRSQKHRVVSDGSKRYAEAPGGERRTVSSELPSSPKHHRTESGSEKFRRATDQLRSGLADASGDENHKLHSSAAYSAGPESDRQQSARNRGQSRNIMSGATAGAAIENDAAARGKAAHERRKREALAAANASKSSPRNQPAPASKPTPQAQSALLTNPTSQGAPATSSQLTSRSQPAAASRSVVEEPPVNPIRAQPRSGNADWGPAAGVPASPTSTRGSSEMRRSTSKKLQKIQPGSGRRSLDAGKPQLQENRLGANQGKASSLDPLEPDPVPKETVRTSEDTAVPYSIPPQTAAAKQAKQAVSFSPDVVDNEREDGKSHRFGDMFGGHHVQARGYQSKVKPLDEWREAKCARLTAADLRLNRSDEQRDSTWWESSGRRPATQTAASNLESYQEEATGFDPPLYLKCGPLLRFAGLRKENGVATTWRGSIMILTEDASSDIEEAPVLRLFVQDMDLYRPPPVQEQHENEEHEDGHHEEDAVTGQVKLSRIGRPIYVRSVHDIEHGVDLSQLENKNGLFSAIPAPSKTASRVHGRHGETSRQYREVKAHRLHVEHGCTFWRFNIEVELSANQTRIAYRINNGPAVGFWVPGKGDTMNTMFHSCNGFSLTVNADDFCGPDPLWRDVLNRHQKHPFHVMIGGGDQIYNDAAIRDTTHFKEWLQIKNPEHKHHADFTAEMQEELESYFFERYAMWFSQGLFGMANAQIPMVNMYDDHDIIDGFGSYPHHFMSSPVFTGLGAVAFKYYMLFQHQSLPAEMTKEEPSWLLGASPGPYINELNRSIFVWLGDAVALLAVDCRTERMRDEILSLQSYDLIFDRCRKELVKGETNHLIVLLGVPIAYPRLNFLENILTSRVMDPIKALGRTGALGGFVNRFDGGVEILDDLDDHWTAKHHKAERNWFVQELQELAAEKSVRVTLLGGDVHLGAVGQFYSNKKLGLAKDRDHRYMPNVISSAIVNTPPPPMMADVLNRRNKIHHLDHETDEDMIPMFDHDVDGSRRSNKRLLPRRNYAIIKEYQPGSTPPSTPPLRDNLTPEQGEMQGQESGQGRAYPPGSMNRRTLGRGPGSLIRRLSLRGRNNQTSFVPATRRPFSFHEQGEQLDTEPRRSNSLTTTSESQRPVNTFQRRPTNLSVKEARKAAAKGGPEDEDDRLAGHINLEGGLDISLCMEIDQHDPAGHTMPYRLLVPALWYEGPGDKNTLTLPARRPSLFQRMTSGRRAKQVERAEPQQAEAGAVEDDYDSLDSYASTDRPNNQGELEDMQATAAGAGRGTDYGVDGAFGQPRSAFQKGYSGGPPPIGGSTAHEQARQEDDPGQQHDEYDSLTPSQEESYRDESPAPDTRRFSKAERFFGIGDEGRSSEGVSRHASEAGAKKKPTWMSWRRGGSLRNWPGSQYE